MPLQEEADAMILEQGLEKYVRGCVIKDKRIAELERQLEAAKEG